MLNVLGSCQHCEGSMPCGNLVLFEYKSGLPDTQHHSLFYRTYLA